jgi:two-component system, sporulation sensor kinase E
MNTVGRKILIVDDNLEFTEMVKQHLNVEGFQTSIALDGKTAIEKISTDFPEMVLLDLKLPDIPGEEVLKRIKELSENTAIIVVTGYGGEQVAVDLMKAGATDFLSKPLKKESLLRAIKDALQIRDAQIEEKRSEKDSSLEKFFPFLAHEIRNPLHAIGGALAIIQRRANLEDEFVAKSVQIIQEEIYHLNEFVRECLDFVRPAAQSRFVEVDINEIIPLTVNMTFHIFDELSEKIKIDTETELALPKVYANYEEIKQVFLNIAKNAVEAMPGEGELKIKTSFKPDPYPGFVEVTFIDNGSGIKKEKMKNLFQPFFTTKMRGTGLGLAICRRIIIDRHHGKIHIESEEGKGTKVTVELPCGQAMSISEEKEL